jgi:hypothetical protein
MNSYNLVQAFRSTQARWASANDENVNGTGIEKNRVSGQRSGSTGSPSRGRQGGSHVGMAHPALENVLEAGHALQSFTSDVQHKKRVVPVDGSN